MNSYEGLPLYFRIKIILLYFIRTNTKQFITIIVSVSFPVLVMIYCITACLVKESIYREFSCEIKEIQFCN